jgi:hypothetical protein
MNIHRKKVAAGQRKKYPAKECKDCATHEKLSEMRYICEFWCVLALRDSTP